MSVLSFQIDVDVTGAELSADDAAAATEHVRHGRQLGATPTTARAAWPNDKIPNTA